MNIEQTGLGWVFLAVTVPLVVLAFFGGRARANNWLTQHNAALSSAVNFYGYFPALLVLGISCFVFAFAGMFGETLVRTQLASELPSGFSDYSDIELDQYLNRIAGSATSAFQSSASDGLFNAIRDRYLDLMVQVKYLTAFVSVLLSLGSLFYIYMKFTPQTRVRVYVEKIFEGLLLACAAVAIFTTAGIVFSLISDSLQFFTKYQAELAEKHNNTDVPSAILSFLFGTEWNAQTHGSSTFGAVPLFFGTVVIAIIAMIVALPVGIFSAVYLSEYASASARNWIKPTLEVLAGIPTVVYGFFAMLVISPLVQMGAGSLNEIIHALGGTESFFSGSSKNAISAGFVMGVMIVPFVSSLSDDVIRAVPQPIRDGALALGATKSETISQVVLPAAFPGIIAATLLAVSRAIGETMIVVMAAGQSAQITSDLTAEITTVTVKIVDSMTLDAAFDSATALSAFALGLVLFMFTLLFNLVAFNIVNRYRKRYA